MTTGNRFLRAIGAGVLAELVIIGSIMFLIVLIKKFAPAVDGMTLAHGGATWTELLGGPVVIFFAARWVVGPLASLRVAHALVVVAVAVAGQLSLFTATVREGHAPLWIVALAVVLKIAAAVAAGSARTAAAGVVR